MGNELEREMRGLFGFSIWYIATLALLLIVLGFISFAGEMWTLPVRTAAERVVYEQSYQKQAGDDQAINLLAAEKAQIKTRLADPDLDPRVKRDLEANLASIEVQLSALQN